MLSNRKIVVYILLFCALWPLLLSNKTAQAQTGADLNLVLPDEELYVGSTLTVDINIMGAVDLYGLQVDCQVDSTILTWQTAQFGDFFTESLVGTNEVDATAGTWSGAISQRNPAPALTGDGLFATLTFEVIDSGTTTLTCTPLAVDRDGNELPIVFNSETITVIDTSAFSGEVSGQATYQGRTTHAGIQIKASGPFTKSIVSTETGQFAIDELDNGAYIIEADADLHLPNCASVTVSQDKIVTLAALDLAGGDVDDSGAIKINDATLVGSNFGLSDTSSPAMDARADINADGEVNVQDLSMLGGNFGKEGCQEWNVVSSSSAETSS